MDLSSFNVVYRVLVLIGNERRNRFVNLLINGDLRAGKYYNLAKGKNIYNKTK